mmetsp:Transcript_18465/g.43202  ORF Transcript_18465/g.43202 Transcript_18465/m.43202 type:complete len:324 (-) Transcript_18465:281-1252(-)
MDRDRVCSPGPQVKLHTVHCVQSLTSASHLGHSLRRQPCVCMRLPGQSSPPFCAKRSIWRCRLVWACPQERSQGPQSAHSDILQSTGSKPQVFPCVISPTHGWPPFAASVTMLLSLNRMLCKSQVLQIPQSPSWQSTALPTSHPGPSSVHFAISLRLPSHVMPPRCACTSICRRRVRQPSPQVTVQEVHSSQELSKQGCGTVCLQPTVSSSTPKHGFPPFIGVSSISRLLYLCPDACPGSLQPLHSLQGVTLQFRGLMQSAAQRFVVSRGPVHGGPHSLFTSLTIRLRLQRPSHVGCCQSDHGLKMHGIGMQSWHGRTNGHSV